METQGWSSRWENLPQRKSRRPLVLAIVGALLVIAVIGIVVANRGSDSPPSTPKLTRISPQAQQAFNEYIACRFDTPKGCESHLKAFISESEAKEISTCLDENPSNVDVCRARFAHFVGS